MAVRSVPTSPQKTDGPGSGHDLFLRGGKYCLTVKPIMPSQSDVDALCDTILGLAKAAESIADDLQGEEVLDQWNTGLALEGIAHAIVLHATLAQAANAEIHRGKDGAEGAS